VVWSRVVSRLPWIQMADLHGGQGGVRITTRSGVVTSTRDVARGSLERSLAKRSLASLEPAGVWNQRASGGLTSRLGSSRCTVCGSLELGLRWNGHCCPSEPDL
jgi:hypothetical protein